MIVWVCGVWGEYVSGLLLLFVMRHTVSKKQKDISHPFLGQDCLPASQPSIQRAVCPHTNVH